MLTSHLPRSYHTKLEIIVDPRRSIRASYTDPKHAARDAVTWRKAGVHKDRILIDGDRPE